MREIKFRAWDKNKKKMIYDIQSVYDSGPGPCDSFKDFLECEGYEIMQYTGLKDTNDTEIYEGDVVLCDGYEWEIVWDENTACFNLETIHEDICATFDNYWSIEVEVIGSIYENPELLEEDEE